MITNKNFLAAGNATFTLGNGRGEHCTYRIKRSKRSGRYFIHVLRGPDNTRDYNYLGEYFPEVGAVRPTPHSQYEETSKAFRVLRMTIDILFARRALPEGYTLQHAGRCCACGRLLTTPESIESGIGPICADRLGAWYFSTSMTTPDVSDSPFDKEANKLLRKAAGLRAKIRAFEEKIADQRAVQGELRF